jgi:hypothetical protein
VRFQAADQTGTGRQIQVITFFDVWAPGVQGRRHGTASFFVGKVSPASKQIWQLKVTIMGPF